MEGDIKKKQAFATDREKLDFIKKTIFSEIRKGNLKLKVGDLLKIMEIQKKLSEDSGAEKEFWELIDQIRQEELSNE